MTKDVSLVLGGGACKGFVPLGVYLFFMLTIILFILRGGGLLYDYVGALSMHVRNLLSLLVDDANFLMTI